MSAAMSQLERDIHRIAQLVRGLEEVSVPDTARMFKKTPEWVRANLPIIVHGPRSQRVRLVDIEEYRARRTVWPKNGRSPA